MRAGRGTAKAARSGGRRLEVVLVMVLVIALPGVQGMAQDSTVRLPKVRIGGFDAQPDWEAVGRKAVRRAERQAFEERFPMEDRGRDSGPGDTGEGPSGVDVLTATQGVDFNPYLRAMLKRIYRAWVVLLPAEARPPQNAQGTTLIRYTLNPEGRVMAMALDGSSHNEALNRAAWAAIAGARDGYGALPKEFTGPRFELRIHFLVNKGSAGGKEGKGTAVP